MTNAEVKREQESERTVALPWALNSRSKLAESLTAVCAAKHHLSREKKCKSRSSSEGAEKVEFEKVFFLRQTRREKEVNIIYKGLPLSKKTISAEFLSAFDRQKREEI